MSQFHKEMMDTMPPNGGRKTGVKGAKKAGMKVKPGFKTGVPGKTGPDRSGGTPKAKVYADSEGL
jgi:hypothetical protein